MSHEPLSHGTGTLQCLQKEMATCRHWSVCPCGETMTMSHIVETCPLTKLYGSLSRLLSADDYALSWLTNYGPWHAYKKEKNEPAIWPTWIIRWPNCSVYNPHQLKGTKVLAVREKSSSYSHKTVPRLTCTE